MCIYILYLFIFLMKNKVNQIYICIFHGLSSNSMYSTLLTKVPNFVKFSQNLNLLHNFSTPACAPHLTDDGGGKLSAVTPKVPTMKAHLDMSLGIDACESCDSECLSSVG